MEDALALKKIGSKIQKAYVLILVVMEDALAQGRTNDVFKFCISLNPCCNGRCTRTGEADILRVKV